MWKLLRRPSPGIPTGLALAMIFGWMTAFPQADDPVHLSLSPNPNGGVTLSWQGGSPMFRVFRSTSPAGIEVPGNALLETAEFGTDDLPPIGGSFFYKVQEGGTCYTPVADAYVVDGAPTTNFGSDPTLRAAAGPAQSQPLLRFQLDGIPAGATIDAATLTLWQETPGGYSLALRSAGGPWLESQVTWKTEPPAGATWDTQIVQGGAGRRSFDARTLVRSWIGGADNDGLLLAPASANSFFDVTFASRETDPARSPRLCISWTERAAEALTQLGAASQTPPVVRFEGGHLASLDVRVTRGSADPVAAALLFLHEFRGLYGLDDPRGQLFLRRRATRDGMTSITFGARHDNLRIDRGAIVVLLDPDLVRGSLSALSVPVEFSGVNSLTAAQATGKALLALLSLSPDTRRPFGAATLEWYRHGPHDVSPARLAWRVGVAGFDSIDMQSRMYHVFVDAENGAALRTRDLDEAAERPDEDFLVQGVNNTTSSTCWELPWESDDDNWFDEDGVVEYPGSDLFSEGPIAEAGMHSIYAYYYDRFGWRSWNGLGLYYEGNVHVGSGYNNAAYRSGCGQMVFGDGWVTSDIVGHEFTHGLVDHTSDLDYENQSGALNESLADFFGSRMDGNWLIGEGRGGRAGAPLRDMSNPPLRGQPDHMDPARDGLGVGLATLAPGVEPDRDANDNGWVHFNSGIPNKAAWLLAEGGNHNGFTITGLGVEMVARIYFTTMVAALSEESNFAAARDAVVAVAHALQERGVLTSTQTCNVINAWASVGVGDPDTDCDGEPDPPTSDGDGDGVRDGVDNCPMDRNPEQRDIDGDRVGNHCDPDMDGDLVPNVTDNCPEIINTDQADADGDGRGDLCDDDDHDRILDIVDNCLSVYNPTQFDTDGDGQGNLCDADMDNDGFSNLVDHCVLVASLLNTDTDLDGRGDQCDNCVSVSNVDQADLDLDGAGDACDGDIDGDDVPNASDNCVQEANIDQFDNDGDGVGLACDLDEQEGYDGMRHSGSRSLWMIHQDIGSAMRLPIFPCGMDSCPEALPEDFAVDVTLATSPKYLARIVDDLGRVVARRDPGPGAAAALHFSVGQDYLYKGGLNSPWFQGRRYFLELMAPAGSQSGQTMSGTIQVDTGIGQ